MSNPSTEYTLVSWNLLVNHLPGTRVPPQLTRIDNLVGKIKAKTPDICGLYEVDASIVGSMNKRIGHTQAESTQYSEERYKMAMSLSSNNKTASSSIIDFGVDQRKAIISQIGDITVVATHLSYKPFKTKWRVEQVRQILDAVKDKQKVIIMGDLNAVWQQKPRVMIKQAGFESVASKLQPAYPITFPSDNYKKFLRFYQKLITVFDLSIDDIYLKNIYFIEGGLIEGESDHYGIWAKVKA